MTDLTFCYLHMTRHDIEVLDTIGTPDYLNGDLCADDIDMPAHLRPPNPEESEVLPSQVHPSYPYGNPMSVKHPAALPRRPYDPTSRALFEDMGYGGGGVNGSIRWKDLALTLLFPVDSAREDADKAAQARQMASGTASNQQQPQQQQQVPPQQQQVPPPNQQIVAANNVTEDEEDNGTLEADDDETEDVDDEDP
ncbi:uncharacterized protein BXZ73DRAFT_98709 [Epithele typhae]|uniref:uncharacterized protein n=1 Tax=Epithele typhae TaxID=378194 RepID=UPI00200891C0|nr:uncharacterized protein BXZ73DRAFT_98709 [Epithele typhae]KAH9940877.1 hypothetical protein BXZ73DRAFT_98709 [Epithele typhae]